jgi:hypothetical protein
MMKCGQNNPPPPPLAAHSDMSGDAAQLSLSQASDLLEFCCLCELNEVLGPVTLGDERLRALAGLRRCLRARACTGHRKRNVRRAQGYLGADCPESEVEKKKSDRGSSFRVLVGCGGVTCATGTCFFV